MAMKILYFGIYNPNYSRNRVLIKGLKNNGVAVAECNVTYHSSITYLKLLWKYLLSKKDFDVMVVGFPGQEVMFLARCLTRKPIIFDAFTSHYEGYILDRQKFSRNSLRARWYRWLDRVSCQLADLVLLDTQAHIDYFINEFDLPVGKFRRIFVGTDSDIFYPQPEKITNARFTVHFHGHYIPLQGVKYIVVAAKLLEREAILFNLVGQGQEHQAVRALAEEQSVSNINFIGEVSYDKLSELINTADICLGVFGVGSKARVVIPNKIFEAIACAKPVITADTPAVRELFNDNENIMLCQVANPQDLADKIMILKNDTTRRARIGQAGYKLFQTNLTENIIGAMLRRFIKAVAPLTQNQ